MCTASINFHNLKTMKRNTKHQSREYLIIFIFTMLLAACGIPKIAQPDVSQSQPDKYGSSSDTNTAGNIPWREFFNDPYLQVLIDSALLNNQEQRILFQEINIAASEARARKGEYLPFVGIGLGSGVDKVGRYTSRGASDANTEVKPGTPFPEPLGNLTGGLYASWELDIWKKLRRARKAAMYRYAASTEGRNFAKTQLVAEIANSYFELLALDKQLAILKQNITIQSNALEIVRLQKTAAKVTELAVKRFEAEVAKNKSLQFSIEQDIIEMENRINFLAGRYPQHVSRSTADFQQLVPKAVSAGIPIQLLSNRPDIRQAELELKAAKLNVQVARAGFYPSVTLRAGVGYEAFNAAYLLRTPESMLYSLAGDLVAPLVNRNAIKANFNAANARQIQAVYQYDRTLLQAHIEVVNQLSKISNLEKSYTLRRQQVEALTESIDIANLLFQSARADYMEVLLTQRDALESRFELVETQKQQLMAVVNVYQALGGGWR